MQERYSGAFGPARALVVAQIQRRHAAVLVICKDRKVADELRSDLEFFAPGVPTVLLSGWETIPFEEISPEILTSAERIRALEQLSRGAPGIVLATPEGLMQRVPSQELLFESRCRLTIGSTWKRDDLIQRFVRGGYTHVTIVEAVGEIAVRGGVIDIFPSTEPEPIRIEFLDDVIETIRCFNRETQRSSTNRDSVDVLPVIEALSLAQPSPHAKLLEGATFRLKERAMLHGTPPSELAKVTAAMQSGASLPGAELFQAVALAPLESVATYINPQVKIVMNDQFAVQLAADEWWEQLTEHERQKVEAQFLVPLATELAIPWNELHDFLDGRTFATIEGVELHQTAERVDEKLVTVRSKSNIELATRMKTGVGSGTAFAPLKQFIDEYRAKQYRIALVVGSDARAERLHRALLEYDIDAQSDPRTGVEWIDLPDRTPVSILQGHLSQGVVLTNERVVLISESDVFGERSYRRRGQTAATLTKRLLNSLAQLKEGDHIVHVDYGIGIYRGIIHITIEGQPGDFLQVDYLDSRLYLPVLNIGKIQKFSAAEGQRPTLDKLASTKWKRTKNKVRQSVVALAGELIKLYAARNVAKGWRFEPEGAEDDRFADGFPFNETADQMKAIHETLDDMAKDKPMDRLVCGDVGFGKTEVALRAAFKCSQHARQTAVLVPTTILVEQHRNTFASRLRDYPVKVGAVSRFYSAQDNKKTLEQLAKGEIDIIVGTHRLLQRDVVFNDLGLVVIDEEHRFGVKQKERLKQIKKQVDVLTLTATPIPRTLYMSLLDIRDVSVIQTAPHDRRVIRTYVAAYSDSLIRDAILRELKRGGQVFYLHNRVQSIAATTARLAELVPEARFVFGHGQMTEKHLEEVMRSFIDGEADVLVSTTIIESGLDIPRANTIIVERSDTFGLAQLYQIRGRVGRSTQQAYAYLLIPKSSVVSEEAQKRLHVLQSLDDIGMGFNLALRDLEIRGAGNLLGKEQSGNVAAIGFELYTQILREAVLHLKGEEPSVIESVDPEIRLGVDAFIPEEYIPDLSERLVLYQRLAVVTSPAEVDELELEIEDRFGHFGEPVKNYLDLMRLKSLLRVFGVARLELGNGKLTCSFIGNAPIDGGKIASLVAAKPDRYRFSKSMVLAIFFPDETLRTAEDVKKRLLPILERMYVPPARQPQVAVEDF